MSAAVFTFKMKKGILEASFQQLNWDKPALGVNESHFDEVIESCQDI